MGKKHASQYANFGSLLHIVEACPKICILFETLYGFFKKKAGYSFPSRSWMPSRYIRQKRGMSRQL